MDTYTFKLNRNMTAVDLINGYLGTLVEQDDEIQEKTTIEFMKLAGKEQACEQLLTWLRDDLDADPVDICYMLKADMDSECENVLYLGLIEPSIIFKASSEACEEILYLLL